MPARLSVIVRLSGLAKVRRAKVPLSLVSALQDDPEYSAELPEDRTSHLASRRSPSLVRMAAKRKAPSSSEVVPH